MVKKTQYVDLDKWRAQLPELKKRYDAESLFPHIIIDDFASKVLRFLKKQKNINWLL